MRKKAVSCIKRCADKIFVFGGELRWGGKTNLSRKLLNFDSALFFNTTLTELNEMSNTNGYLTLSSLEKDNKYLSFN